MRQVYILVGTSSVDSRLMQDVKFQGDRKMSLKPTSRLRKILLRGTPIVLLVCAVVIILFSLYIELGVKNICALAMQAHPGDRVEALMKFVKTDGYGYNARVYSKNNRVFWALGQLGDKRALPVLKGLMTGEPCDHDTNLCQGEIMEAIQKLEANQFNLPKFLWRGVLN